MTARPAPMRKFEFDRSFDVAAVRHLEIVPPPEPPPPPPPTFSAEELEAARGVAFAEGLEAGRAEALAGIEQQLAMAAVQLAETLERTRDDQTRLIHAIERQAATTMLDLAERVLPALVRREGLSEIEAIIDEAMSTAIQQPRLTIRCNSELMPRITRMAATAADRIGYAGSVAVNGDPAMAATDCRVEWATGGVERQAQHALENITTAIRTALAQPTEELPT